MNININRREVLWVSKRSDRITNDTTTTTKTTTTITTTATTMTTTTTSTTTMTTTKSEPPDRPDHFLHFQIMPLRDLHHISKPNQILSSNTGRSLTLSNTSSPHPREDNQHAHSTSHDYPHTPTPSEHPYFHSSQPPESSLPDHLPRRRILETTLAASKQKLNPDH